MAYIPSSGSVVAFQSDPTKFVGTVSVIGNMNSSVTAFQGSNPWLVNMPSPSVISYQLAGSVMAVNATVNTGNSSVQLLGGVSTIGSVVTLQGTIPWQVNVPTPSYISYQAAGSVMAVSGSFSAGNTSVQLLGGTANIGSVTAIQGTNPWQINVPSPSTIAYQLAGSIMAVSATVNTGNSSVQVLNAVTVTQNDPTKLVGTMSVMGTLSVLGTVPVTQSTSPWIVNVPTSSYIAYQAAGSIMAVSATVNTGNSSVQLLQGVAVIGSVAVLQATNPWNINMPSPSVIAYQLAGSIMQVTGGGGGTQYTENNAPTPSVVGNAILYKKDETNSVLSAVSPQHPLPIQGSITALQGTSPWIMNMPSPSIVAIQSGGSVTAVRTDNASVIAVLTLSSVAVLQGTNPWIINQPSPSIIAYQLAGSIMAVNNTVTTGNSSVQVLGGVATIGSVVSLQGTTPWVIQSVVGTYSDNSAWTEGNSGIYMLGVRNDTMSSVSAADLRYTPLTVGPSGENITANAPLTKWVQGFSSTFGAASIQVIAPQGASIFTYITGLQVANGSANNVYLTFTGGLGGISSVLGYTVAPANGGSNIVIPNAWKTGANSGFSASVSGISSIFLSAQGFISKT